MKHWQTFWVALLAILLFPVTVSATESQVQVSVGDTCPNIGGHQSTLPAGMQHDSDGNCFTPVPPQSPDVCSNLNGLQRSIPSGYYRTTSGNCAQQTQPPKDVCPNLEELQVEVPYGMLNTKDGDCIWPPHDLCPNIDGPQDKMPKGMRQDENGDCYTPSSTSTPRPSTQTPDEGKHDRLNLLPFYIIASLGFVAILLFAQTIRESLTTRHVIVLFKRRRKEVVTLDQILLLLIPYLYTAIDTMSQSAKEPFLASLHKARTNLESISGAPTEKLETDLTAFSRSGIHSKALRTPLFFVPVTLTIIATVVANIALNSPLDLSVSYIGLQILGLSVVCSMLFLILRARHIRHIQHEHVEQLLNQTATRKATHEDTLHNISLLLDMELHELSKMDQSVLNDQFKKYLGQLVTLNQKLHLLYVRPQVASRNDTEIYNELEKILMRYTSKATIA